MLEEMEKTNANLEENLIVGQAINNTSMLGLVGKKVTVEGDKATVTGGAATENMISAELPGTATVEVKDATGRVVATYDKTVSSGLNDLSWDGHLGTGAVAGDGEYTLSVTLKNNAGTEVPFKTLMTGAVDGLRYESNQAVVMVGGQEFFVSEIYKVS
jgi:flagellar basal-body rod modification protein FlgD